MRASSTLLLLSSVVVACNASVSGTGGSPQQRTGGEETTTEATGGTGGTQTPAEPGAPDYEALFDAPADPTTTEDLVTGVWAGSTSYGEVRLKITADKVVIAMKCGDAPAVGVEVGSVVTDAKMRMLASKSVGASVCSIKVTPIEIARCPDSYTTDCFDILDGTRLKFFGTPPFTGGGASSYEYTKLSD